MPERHPRGHALSGRSCRYHRIEHGFQLRFLRRWRPESDVLLDHRSPAVVADHDALREDAAESAGEDPLLALRELIATDAAYLEAWREAGVGRKAIGVVGITRQVLRRRLEGVLSDSSMPAPVDG